MGHRFVEDLPDLIRPEEYQDHPEGRLVRVRIRVTDEGVEVLGDAMRPEVVERVLRSLGQDPIDQMLCG
ncbi:radical SAM-modified peptide, FtsH ternary system-associated [Nonomuraea sp. NPDC049152]|uniref:radical SAM-modified peptide, FtsH ternary system-associated n=1 Tax=Nonomuraea sp. NPDC049152 TaxID=3154350 RepID=UPI0033C5C93F